MNATRILPDLQSSLPCEDVRREVTGHFIILGVINYIHVQQVPVIAPRLCIFNRWTAGVGQFIESVRLVAPDQTTVLRKHEMKFDLPGVNRNTSNLTMFGQVEFKVPGVYFIEVCVDDVLKIRYPLVVKLLAPPPTEGQPEPESVPVPE
ncbi:MAG TPA: hypothetical protein VN281_15060 [Verrucomicrobiae bacterium]|jgi:hypothetical protein|nr:hypothetical protein [Verrucomicrobiae bacterium]